MRKRTRKLFAVVMAVTTCVFAVMGSGCSSVSDWVKDKYDQLTCEHLTEKFIPAVAPTCTEKGSTEGIECADCGKVLTEPSEVAALGHTLEHYEALEATCMQTGLTEGEYCTVCEEWIVEQDTVKRTGHKVVTVKGKRPTCTETGLTDGQACDHCGVVYVAQKEIPMIEHYYSNGVCLNCGDFDYSIFEDETRYTEVPLNIGDKYVNKWIRVYADTSEYHHKALLGLGTLPPGSAYIGVEWVDTEISVFTGFSLSDPATFSNFSFDYVIGDGYIDFYIKPCTIIGGVPDAPLVLTEDSTLSGFLIASGTVQAFVLEII